VEAFNEHSLALSAFKANFYSDYISAAQKAELRQQAIEMGLLPREAQEKVLSEQQLQQQEEGQGGETNKTTTAPPTGTYS